VAHRRAIGGLIDLKAIATPHVLVELVGVFCAAGQMCAQAMSAAKQLHLAV
jgi:hypothetical protein